MAQPKSKKPGPPMAIFPNFNVLARTPDGIDLKGRVWRHADPNRPGTHFYSGYVNPTQKDDILEMQILKDQFDRDGIRPDYFAAESTAMPGRFKLNEMPDAKKSDKQADGFMIGEVWLPNRLFTLLASPATKSDSLLFAVNMVPSTCEVENNPNSLIAKYHVTPEERKAAMTPG